MLENSMTGTASSKQHKQAWTNMELMLFMPEFSGKIKLLTELIIELEHIFIFVKLFSVFTPLCVSSDEILQPPMQDWKPWWLFNRMATLLYSTCHYLLQYHSFRPSDFDKISVGVYEREDYIAMPTYNSMVVRRLSEVALRVCVASYAQLSWFLSLMCIKLFLPTCHVMPLPQSCAAKSVNRCCLHG